MRPLTVVVIATLSLVGCGKKKPVEEIDTTSLYLRAVVEKTTADGLVLEEIDVDLDGVPDIFNYYRERTNAPRLLVRKELDVNRDGRIDTTSYFTDAGELEREVMDRDFDGQVDWTDHYQNGQRVMSEFDTTANGLMNEFAYYAKGRITHKERDSTGDGLIDTWERFDANGKVVKTGRDIDGDGKMDERDE